MQQTGSQETKHYINNFKKQDYEKISICSSRSYGYGFS